MATEFESSCRISREAESCDSVTAPWAIVPSYLRRTLNRGGSAPTGHTGTVIERAMNTPYPEWLHIAAWSYLSLCFLCSAIIIVDELRHPQKMMIMNFVWPITAQYGGPVALWGYLKSSPKTTKQHLQQMKQEVEAVLQRESMAGMRQPPQPSDERDPTREQVAVADTHAVLVARSEISRANGGFSVLDSYRRRRTRDAAFA